MDREVHNETVLKRYLLGEVSSDECDKIEREYLANKDCFEQLLAVEDDLLDEYARGELSAHEREQLERKLFAAPQQREKLRHARVFQESMRRQRLESKPAKKPAFSKTASWLGVLTQRRIIALATVLLLVSAAWLAIRVWQRNAQLQPIQAGGPQSEEKQPQLPSTPETLQRVNNQPIEHAGLKPAASPSQSQSASAPFIATFVLPMTLTRGDTATTFVLKPGIETVRLQAQIAGAGYKTYRAELQSADGDHIQSFTGLKPQHAANGYALLINVPAKLLSRSDYILKLSGIVEGGRLEEAGFFSFRITRE